MKMNLKKSFKKGFTLIELLVVVAIIGILASVVLASLNSARAKGVDAAIKGTLSNSRAQAALYYEENTQEYTGVCANAGGVGPMVLSAIQKLNLAGGAVGAGDFFYDPTGVDANSAVCHDSATEWAAIVSLKVPTTPTSGWCVDSAGASKEATVLATGVTVC